MAEKKPEPTQKTPKGLEIPVPKRRDVMDFFDRVSGGRASRKRPVEKAPPPKQSE
jgi:hypothetical protein